MGENIQTQFRTEGQPAFQSENTENDNSADSSTDQTNADQTGSSDQDQNQTQENGGKDTNFADHPRWKEREDDWKIRFNEQEERHTQELQTLREEFETKYGNRQQPTAPVEVPPWFGGDEDQWNQFQEWNRNLVAQAEENAIKRLSSQQEQEQKKIDEATQYFNSEVAEIEADKQVNPEGLKVDRNRLLKTAMDNDLVDSKGRWNYKAAFKMMKPAEVFQAKKALDEKRNLASASTSENRAEAKPSTYSTSETFKNPANRPW